MRIALGSDRVGLELKEQVKQYLQRRVLNALTLAAILRSGSIIRSMPRRWGKQLVGGAQVN